MSELKVNSPSAILSNELECWGWDVYGVVTDAP